MTNNSCSTKSCIGFYFNFCETFWIFFAFVKISVTEFKKNGVSMERLAGGGGGGGLG